MRRNIQCFGRESPYRYDYLSLETLDAYSTKL